MATTPKTTENKAPATQQVAISEKVRQQIADLTKKNQIALPSNYSPENALKSAWLVLQETQTRDKKPVLQACTPASIQNTLFDMVIQGLSPAKKQCYFIPYGNQLQLSRSYLGTVAVTKRLKGIKDVKAHVIYEGDTFETEYDIATASVRIKEFKPSFGTIDIKKIIGAFAVIIGENGPIHTEIMTIAQIKAAWNQGAAKGNSGAHNNFAEEMAKKSVINRACKTYWNTSDDSDLLIEAINNSTDSEEEPKYDSKNMISDAEYEVQQEDEAPKVIVEAQVKSEPVQQTIEDEDIYEGTPFK
ncbi:recombinase RecT [Proteiniclasticum sp. SCR006]|uniref:Recombinase RecT n=1 Tax=Proteiniclasticum aestuarii TaxID=2817862 RepID=A0A939KGE7_9CLOT|nr:recombinase RecT [Proteiniclasticum aestuarii]MBO1264344.1 recombinase RecT [Proteiniclasticum aestuarii]